VNALVRNVLICFFILQCLILSGCNSFQAEGIKLASKKESNIALKEIPSTLNPSNIVPIKVEEQKFNSIGDWYDNQSILFTLNEGEGSKIYKYDIYNGDTELFYETSEQVIKVEGNHNLHYFIVHTAGLSHKANLFVLDNKGRVIVEWEVESAELQYEWNPFDENQLFITSFLEDWSFQNYVVSLDTGQVEPVDLSQPFIQWLDKSEITYLRWSDTSIDAPLYRSNISTNKEEKLLDHILAFHTYKDLLLTISSSETFTSYQFFDPRSMKELSKFQMPSITTFSDRWWIPNYDYNFSTQKFYYFKPIMDDDVLQSLSLVSFSVETGEEIVVLSEIEDQPLKLSPDGQKLLYGFQFIELIDLQSHEVFSLINQT
jgi:hypothetical protein